MGRASVSVVSNIAEGFGMKSDAHFVRFRRDARGSAEELRVHLEIALHREAITPEQCHSLRDQFAEISRVLSGLIRYLRESNWTDRRR